MWAKCVAKGVTLVIITEIVYHTFKWLFPTIKEDTQTKCPTSPEIKRPEPIYPVDHPKRRTSDAVANATHNSREALNKRKPYSEWNTVIMFRGEREMSSSLNQLLNYIDEAKPTIFVCMYLCSNYDFTKVLMKKHDEGLLIQVITDHDTWTAHNNSGFKYLKKMGIETRVLATGYLMHHKFIIIDEEAILTGSLNWTKQGVTSNNENVLISTNAGIVSRYLEEYNKLWAKCTKPQVGSCSIEG